MGKSARQKGGRRQDRERKREGKDTGANVLPGLCSKQREVLWGAAIGRTGASAPPGAGGSTRAHKGEKPHSSLPRVESARREGGTTSLKTQPSQEPGPGAGGNQGPPVQYRTGPWSGVLSSASQEGGERMSGVGLNGVRIPFGWLIVR